MVHDAWDEVTLPWQGDTSVATVKQSALEIARVTAAPDAFVVKLGGATIRDESATLAQAGVPANGALIVLRRRRRAVR
jgi:hypothetical protein